MEQQLRMQAPGDAVGYRLVLPPRPHDELPRLSPPIDVSGQIGSWSLRPFQAPNDIRLVDGQLYRVLWIGAAGDVIPPAQDGTIPGLHFHLGPLRVTVPDSVTAVTECAANALNDVESAAPTQPVTDIVPLQTESVSDPHDAMSAATPIIASVTDIAASQINSVTDAHPAATEAGIEPRTKIAALETESVTDPSPSAPVTDTVTEPHAETSASEPITEPITEVAPSKTESVTDTHAPSAVMEAVIENTADSVPVPGSEFPTLALKMPMGAAEIPQTSSLAATERSAERTEPVLRQPADGRITLMELALDLGALDSDLRKAYMEHAERRRQPDQPPRDQNSSSSPEVLNRNLALARRLVDGVRGRPLQFLVLDVRSHRALKPWLANLLLALCNALRGEQAVALWESICNVIGSPATERISRRLRVLLFAGRFDEALPIAQQWLEKDPTDLHTLHDCAYTFLESRELQLAEVTARRYYRLALESFDADELEFAARRLSATLRACGKHQEAERVARILGPEGQRLLAEELAEEKNHEAPPPEAPSKQPVVAQPNISGNATCPLCNSGKKYRKCCGKDSYRLVMSSSSIKDT